MTAVVWIVVAVIVILAIAAAVLVARRPRLRALPDESRARFADEWRRVEAVFVDDPRRSVQEADALAVSILRERGARIEDGKAGPDDLRAARDLARDSGELGHTESLRRAMVAYQRIVDDAVGQSTRRASEARRPEVIG